MSLCKGFRYCPPMCHFCISSIADIAEIIMFYRDSKSMQNRSFRFQTSGSIIQLMFKLQSVTFLCALHSSSVLSSSSYHSEKLPVKI